MTISQKILDLNPKPGKVTKTRKIAGTEFLFFKNKKKLKFQFKKTRKRKIFENSDKKFRIKTRMRKFSDLSPETEKILKLGHKIP